jgi:hypothetical protein
MRGTRFLTGAAVLAATLGPTAIAWAQDPEPVVIDGTVVAVPGVDTAAELEAFVLSAAPKTIHVDAATGDVLSVSAGVTEGPRGRIGSQNTCSAGQACLISG